MSALIVSVVAGLVALGVSAYSADHSCQSFPDARAGVSRLICGPVLDAYRELYGPAGALGLPESDEQDASRIADQSPGHRQQTFEYGVIDLTVATGETMVFRGQGFVPIT